MTETDDRRSAILGMTLPQIEEIARELALPKFAAKQICDWLYTKFARSFDEMSNISKSGREALGKRAVIGARDPEDVAVSADGTKKYLFRTLDNHFIESAYIPMVQEKGERETRGSGVRAGGKAFPPKGETSESGADFDARASLRSAPYATLCLSTQAGCRMACRFCMTARQGLTAQLGPADIINQYSSLPERASVRNIVYMGMGEPLDNTDAVLASIAAFTAPWGMAMSPRRITVSTCGILSGLKRLLEETEVHVALSLHTPFNAEREELMPVARREPLEPIFSLLRAHNWRGQRRLTLEYILFEGLNDSRDHSTELLRLVRGLGDVRVNLLRWNALPAADAPPEADTQSENARAMLRPQRTFRLPYGTQGAASLAALENFQQRLNDAGVIATIRQSRGGDIASACGLLSTRHKEHIQKERL